MIRAACFTGIVASGEPPSPLLSICPTEFLAAIDDVTASRGIAETGDAMSFELLAELVEWMAETPDYLIAIILEESCFTVLSDMNDLMRQVPAKLVIARVEEELHVWWGEARHFGPGWVTNSIDRCWAHR